MGLVKKVKASMVAEDASRAWTQGRNVFTPMLNTPWSESVSYMTSGSVGGWAEMIEAVEAIGWVMEAWEVSTDTKGRPQAYPLFRRPRTGRY